MCFICGALLLRLSARLVTCLVMFEVPVWHCDSWGRENWLLCFSLLVVRRALFTLSFGVNDRLCSVIVAFRRHLYHFTKSQNYMKSNMKIIMLGRLHPAKCASAQSNKRLRW